MSRSDAVIAAAKGWLGTPYQHQASLKGVGCDCLGLVRGVWREVIGPEPEVPPPYTSDWAEASGEETMMAAAMRHLLPLDIAGAEAGDVLLFRWRSGLPAKHAAILIDAETFIHAHDGAAVALAHLAPWWRRRIAGAYRFPEK